MSNKDETKQAVEEINKAANNLIVATKVLVTLCTESAASDDETKMLTKKSVTLEDVRAVLAEKSREGHTAAVRALLVKHGATKLSEIDQSEFSILLAEAEELGNG